MQICLWDASLIHNPKLKLHLADDDNECDDECDDADDDENTC